MKHACYAFRNKKTMADLDCAVEDLRPSRRASTEVSQRGPRPTPWPTLPPSPPPTPPRTPVPRVVHPVSERDTEIEGPLDIWGFMRHQLSHTSPNIDQQPRRLSGTTLVDSAPPSPYHSVDAPVRVHSSCGSPADLPTSL